jgi:hypothetical protein
MLGWWGLGVAVVPLVFRVLHDQAALVRGRQRWAGLERVIRATRPGLRLVDRADDGSTTTIDTMPLLTAGAPPTSGTERSAS